MPIRILTVDDHPLLREGIAAVIEGQPDMQLVGEAASGLEALQVFRDCRPDVTLMDLQMPGMGGVAGYLLKSMLRRELVDTIRSVHAGRRRMPPEIAAGIAEHATDDALSQREIEVLRHVADGNGNKRIAQLLGISEETVKAHMKNILSKLDANDRTHAVTIAVRRGIFDL